MGVVYKKGAYWVDYRFKGQRKRKRIGSSKAVADIYYKKIKVAIAENRYLDINKEPKVKFEELAEMYISLHAKPNKKSWYGDIKKIRILSKSFGGKYINEITPLMIDRYKTERRQKVSPATTNRDLACLKCMFNKAVQWGKLKESPAKHIKLFKENNKRTIYLEQPEINNLLSNCHGYLRVIVIIALNTGMRKGEILGLRWEDIDFNIDIIYLHCTKNGESREIPINKQVKMALLTINKHKKSSYIFNNKQSQPLGDIKKGFLTAMGKSGILKNSKFRFHDLRHTFASHLVMSGVDLNTVRELLGHKSINMTLRYSHLSPRHKQKAVEVLSGKMDSFWTPGSNIEEATTKGVNVTG